MNNSLLAAVSLGSKAAAFRRPGKYMLLYDEEIPRKFHQNF